MSISLSTPPPSPAAASGAHIDDGFSRATSSSDYPISPHRLSVAIAGSTRSSPSTSFPITPPASPPTSPPSSPSISGLGSIFRKFKKKVHATQLIIPTEDKEEQLPCEYAERLLLGRDGVPRDETQAFALLRKLASAGHIHAQALLGFCFEFGLGVDQVDFAAAEKEYIEAGNAGSGLASARMAFLKKYGRPGVKIDRIEAEEWTTKVEKQEPTALQWLRTAADRDNHPAATYALGVCFHDGVGVPKDSIKAVHYYQRSAAAGHPRGEGILGWCYSEGFGVAKDVKRAFQLYMQAAEKGESVSMYNVAHCECFAAAFECLRLGSLTCIPSFCASRLRRGCWR